MFHLHPRLAADTLPVTDLTLCRVLLMNNALFPWLILVPKREGLVEITDLSVKERHLLMDEISRVSEVMATLFKPYKMNVAALGNQVRQLHIHVIARFENDPAWPHPVWGKGSAPYAEKEAQRIVTELRPFFPEHE